MNRVALIVVLLAAAGTGGWQQLKFAEAREALRTAKMELAAEKEQAAAAAETLRGFRAELELQTRERARIERRIAQAEVEVRQKFPERQWTAPPEELPEWNPDSPFVWLRKEIVAQLHLSPFSADGELDSGVLDVLAMEPADGEKLNRELSRVLQEYREIEAALAEPGDQHLPGATGQEGEKMTFVVNPVPEQGERLKRDFESQLRSAMGNQRTEMILKSAEYWIDKNLGNFGKEQKTISVVRMPDGRYGASMKCGSAWESLTGPAHVMRSVIPSHLLPLFAPLFQSPDPTSAKLVQ